MAFKEKTVRIDKYAIYTGYCSSDYGNLRNWVIECLNDSNDLVEIDSYFNCQNTSSMFQVQNESNLLYHYVRLDKQENRGIYILQ